MRSTPSSASTWSSIAAGAAIAIGDEDALMGLAAGADLAPHAVGDLVRPVVPDRRQAGDVEPVPAMDRFSATISRASAPQAMRRVEPLRIPAIWAMTRM